MARHYELLLKGRSHIEIEASWAGRRYLKKLGINDQFIDTDFELTSRFYSVVLDVGGWSEEFGPPVGARRPRGGESAETE